MSIRMFPAISGFSYKRVVNILPPSLIPPMPPSEWVQPTQVAVGYLVWTSKYVFAVKSEKQSFDEVPPSEHDLIFEAIQ